MKKAHVNCAFCLRAEDSNQGECLRLYTTDITVNITNVNSSGCRYWEPNNETKRLMEKSENKINTRYKIRAY